MKCSRTPKSRVKLNSSEIMMWPMAIEMETVQSHSTPADGQSVRMHACTHFSNKMMIGANELNYYRHIFFLRVILCVTNIECVSIVLNQLFHTHQSNVSSNFIRHMKSAFDVFMPLNNQYEILDSSIGF